MPNVNAANGFRPIARIDGAPYGKFGYGYTIADALASNIGYGDLVSRSGTGKNIILAVDGVAGATVVGVFLGCKYRDVRGNIVYAPNWVSATSTFGAQGAQAIVVDDPKVIFRVQASAGFAVADPGQFAGIVISAPSSLGFSTWQLNSADITATLDTLKIIGLSDLPRNDYGTNAKVDVLIAFHEYGDGTYRAS